MPNVPPSKPKTVKPAEQIVEPILEAARITPVKLPMPKTGKVTLPHIDINDPIKLKDQMNTAGLNTTPQDRASSTKVDKKWLQK